ncbi:MAG: hypothetical protein JW771_08100 [Candidatus Thermoplasmatota archaeon]|nr:hypothetical protein [Candidatus Thermoplasmatota archaeon]
MTALLIELVSLVACVVFVLGLYGILASECKKANTFSWHDYFRQCGIYQGVSHWTTLKILIKKVRS